MANRVYQIVTDRVVALLERGVVLWRKPWAGSEARPKNLASGKQYRGINPFLLSVTAWSEGYESPYWLTFRQAKDRGGHVRKGEKATTVIFWKQYTVQDRDPDTKEVTAKTIPVLRTYSVFNAEQTAEVDFPQPTEAVIDFNPIERCESAVAGMPDPPKIEHLGHAAEYLPKCDTIRMPRPERFRSAEHYYSALFHELTHSTGSDGRLARPGITEPTGFGSPEYAREELIAEMGAAFLCGHCGIEASTIEDNASYIAGWIRRLRGNNQLVIRAASAGQKSTDYVLRVTHDDRQPATERSVATIGEA